MSKEVAFRFEGKSAVVTGAGQGIGAEIAVALAGNGARLVLTGRHPESLLETRRRIADDGGQAEICVGDVRDYEHLCSAMERAAGAGGAVDILVNNAGIPGPSSPLEELSLEDWRETVDVNLTGVFLACKAAVPYLRRSGAGRIVNLGSVTGKRPLANRSAYAAAKLGVVGLTRTIAHELGGAGITVNVVSPWFVEGARLEYVLHTMATKRGQSPEVIRNEMRASTALKRSVGVHEVVEVTLFLCSDAASSLTGQDVNVSAGEVMY